VRSDESQSFQPPLSHPICWSFQPLRNMSKSQKSPKNSAKISRNVEERIVEVSLQHPDYGARRLLPLLKKEKLSVSASTVYNILKRNGLQTREKRLAKLEEQSAESAPILKKPPAKIPAEVEAHIVEVSLQHPDFGAKRLLPLLKNEKIDVSASTVYSILKRHGLQTRDMRLLRIEEQFHTEASPQVVETPPPFTVPIPTPAEEPGPIAEGIEEKTPPPRSLRVSKVPAKSLKRIRWFFYVVNLLLLALIGYLGFHVVQKFQQASLDPEAVAGIESAPMIAAKKTGTVPPPLSDYRIIGERNLFNIAKENALAPKIDISLDKLALAKKELGLKLVGTVVANDSRMSLAVINDRKTKKQEGYREGDEVGKVRIKKILRNKVVITTDKGDQLLTIEPEEYGKGRSASRRGRPVAGNYMPSRQGIGSAPFSKPENREQSPRVRTSDFRVKREDVESSIAETVD